MIPALLYVTPAQQVRSRHRCCPWRPWSHLHAELPAGEVRQELGQAQGLGDDGLRLHCHAGVLAGAWVNCFGEPGVSHAAWCWALLAIASCTAVLGHGQPSPAQSSHCMAHRSRAGSHTCLQGTQLCHCSHPDCICMAPKFACRMLTWWFWRAWSTSFTFPQTLPWSPTRATMGGPTIQVVPESAVCQSAPDTLQ